MSKIYMILRDTHKNGRDLGVYHKIHRYADSGVKRLEKLTAYPGTFSRISRAIKMPDGMIWVSTAQSPHYSNLEIAWYPLLPYDGTLLTADELRNDKLIEQLRREAESL